MRFDLDARGIPRAERRFDRMAEQADDLRPLFDDIVDELLAAERRQFKTQSGWRPLAASTRERKRRQGLSDRIMHDTGRLERALTVRGANGQLVDIGLTEVRFGIKGGRSDAYYGRFHQRGKGVPKRIVVPAPTRRTRNAITDVTLRHLTS